MGFAAIALSTAAKADVIYTVTATGTVTTGTSGGEFGVAGTSLVGQTYTITQTFDASLSTEQQVSLYNYLNPARSTATITIGLNTITIPYTSLNNDNNYYGIDVSGGSNDVDEIFAETFNGTGTEGLLLQFQDPSTNFLTTNSLSQELYYTTTNTSDSSVQLALYADNGGFSGTVSAISLNGGTPPAPVPEPRSVVLFGASLAVLAWRRRRCTVR